MAQPTRKTNNSQKPRSRTVKKKRKPSVSEIIKKNIERSKKPDPKYGTSKLEKKFAKEFLDKLGVKYEEQFYAESIKRYYDFYLPDRDILIEYQGVQHYRPVKYFGGEDAYKKQVEIDNLKRDNASKEDLWLVEIPYTLDNKEKIKNFLVEIL